MAVGQAVLSPESGVSLSAAVAARLEAQERDRSASHAEQLRTVLELLRINEAEGLAVGTSAELALLLSSSEYRANDLVRQAQVLASLPGGLSALQDGRLTVEQAATAARSLDVVPIGVRAQVWQRLLARLAADAQAGIVRPPQRLKELLDTLILAADPDSAVDRRRQAERDGDVTYDRRDDGLVDLHAFGISAPDAQACLSNLARRAEPAGDWDDRTAGERRRDALVDLLTGRDRLTSSDSGGSGGCGEGCDCPTGGGGPCGSEILVHVPLATALGLSDLPAQLVGHGPVEPDLLTRLLLAAPKLRAVFVDDNGTPIALSSEVLQPERGDPIAVRQALLKLAHLQPGERFAIHPDDHPPPPEPPGPLEPPEPPQPPESPQPPGGAEHRHPPDPRPDPRVLAAATLGVPPEAIAPTDLTHHAGPSGAYSIRPRLRRFLAARAPRCEWPGCGARASRCDLDHDLHWPDGPTCACNIGPLCRRHHRIKQTGWTKHRHPDGSIRWTSPRGRTWARPAPHPAPPAALRPAAPVVIDLGTLSPNGLEHEHWHTDPTDPHWKDLHADPGWLTVDPEHDPHDNLDHTGQRIRTGASRWDLDLHDHTAWDNEPPMPR